MELEFRPDVEAVVDRWKRFWKGEMDRPMLRAVQPKPGVEPVPMPRPYNCAFGDLDPLINQALAWGASHEFLGDAIPSFMITFAPDHFAALLGGEIMHSAESSTNWVEPCLETLEDAEIRFLPEGRWWKRTVECVERFREECYGKLLITSTHLQGSLDCLVALYGTQPLLLDMALNPDVVHRALGQVDAAMLEVRKAFADILDVSTLGHMNRFGMYSDGLIDVPQCDLSCMISKEMFDDFELPYLVNEIESVTNSIYHLDGPDALQHTESLCGIDALDMIQWMPGEGYYDDDWSELNQKIDALGKGQIFQDYYKLSAGDVMRIWDSLSSRKLFFHVTPEQLHQLI